MIDSPTQVWSTSTSGSVAGEQPSTGLATASLTTVSERPSLQVVVTVRVAVSMSEGTVCRPVRLVVSEAGRVAPSTRSPVTTESTEVSRSSMTAVSSGAWL